MRARLLNTHSGQRLPQPCWPPTLRYVWPTWDLYGNGPRGHDGRPPIPWQPWGADWTYAAPWVAPPPTGLVEKPGDWARTSFPLRPGTGNGKVTP